MKTFVWLLGLRGPEPQLWYDDWDSKIAPLFKVLVDDNLTIEQCVEKFPLPKEKED